MNENNIEHTDYIYTVTVLRSIEEIESIRANWEQLQWHPNADIEHYLTVVKARNEILHPHVIVLNANRTTKALLIGRIENMLLELKLGYKVLYRVKMRTLNIVYGGILGDITNTEICDVLVNELINTLARGEAEMVYFESIPVISYFYEAAKKQPGFLSRDHLTISNIHWKLTLPETYEGFVSNLSKRPRANLRNYSNRFNKKYGGITSIKCFNQPNDLDLIFNDTEAIASKTYHREIGVGFFNNKETYEIYRLTLDHQWLRAYVMYIDGTPVAFWHGYYYGNTFFTGPTGFDPAYTDDRPGTILLTKIIEELCYDHRISSIDFGFGDAEYKRIYCNQNCEEQSVYIFAATIRAISINIVRTTFSVIHKWAENTLSKLGLLTKIKRLWRDRLTQKKADDVKKS